jgi:hypothetical protein
MLDFYFLPPQDPGFQFQSVLRLNLCNCIVVSLVGGSTLACTGHHGGSTRACTDHHGHSVGAPVLFGCRPAAREHAYDMHKQQLLQARCLMLTEPWHGTPCPCSATVLADVLGCHE